MPIAFDAVSTGQSTSLSFNVSHTVTGSQPILFAGIDTNGDGDVITSVAYNGSAMTQIAKLQYSSSAEFMYLYYLVNPSTGTNNISVTKSGGASSVRVRGISYTGAKQTGQPDASTTQAGTNTPASKSITTVANNSWSVMFGVNIDANWAASTGSTARGAASNTQLFDSNAAITPAGSYSMSLTFAGTRNWGLILASIAPDVAETRRNIIVA